MSVKVELYVYDLSNGLAATMGPMLIGRPLEGIWYAPLPLSNLRQSSPRVG